MTVEIWGSGSPMREFLHVDDLADSCLFLMNNYSDADHVNVGTGVDITIRQLAETIRDIVHPEAELVFDASKPDGMPRKVLDITKLRGLGWSPKVEFEQGVKDTYKWFQSQSPDAIRGMGLVTAAV
jgi:GDP-L-fucose synthase